MTSGVSETFLFLTKLAFANRLTLPIFITVAFMVCNFRWEVEISIQTERIAFQPDGDRRPLVNEDNDNDDSNSWIDQDEEYEVDSDSSSNTDETEECICN